MCCVFPTSNAISTFLKGIFQNFHSNKVKVSGMSILASLLVSRVLFCSSPEDGVGNEQGRILETKLTCIEFHCFTAHHMLSFF